MGIDLESLGITKAELQERIIDRAVARIFEVTGYDEDGDEFVQSSPMAKRLEDAIKTAIDNKVSALAEKHVLPLADFRHEHRARAGDDDAAIAQRANAHGGGWGWGAGDHARGVQVRRRGRPSARSADDAG